MKLRFFISIVYSILLISCGRFSLDYEEAERGTILEGEILVASGDSGLFNSFVQDKSGGIHIVYYQIPRATLLWSYSSDLRRGFEKVEIIDKAGIGENFGLSARILVDSSNKPHVVYIRHIEGGVQTFGIYHARREDEGKWIVKRVPTCQFESRAEQLDAVIDPEDIIHIAYIGFDKRLYYIAMRTNGELISCELIDPAVGEAAKVPSGGAISGCVDLTIDSGGNIHVAYYDSENGNTKYAFKKKGEAGWNISVIGWQKVFNEEIKPVQITPGEYTAELKFPSNESKLDTYVFAVGPGGRREVPKDFWRFRGQKNIVFSGNIMGPGKEFELNMRYYVNYVRTDTSPEDDGMFCSVSYDQLLVPNVAFYDSTNMRVKLAQRSGEIWNIEEVDAVPVGSQIYLTNFRVGDKMTPVVMYSDSIRNAIKVAIKNPSPTSEQDKWIKNTIIQQSGTGYRLFSDFLPVYGKIGLSYVKFVKGDMELYFSIFDIIREIKEAIEKGG